MKSELKVNNDLYRRRGHAWWDDDVGEFSTIRLFLNPVRFAYFHRVLARELAADGAKPAELVAHFERHDLHHREMRGILRRRSVIGALLDFRRRKKGEISFQELGQRLDFQQSDHLEGSYMGYAAKRGG